MGVSGRDRAGRLRLRHDPATSGDPAEARGDDHPPPRRSRSRRCLRRPSAPTGSARGTSVPGTGRAAARAPATPRTWHPDCRARERQPGPPCPPPDDAGRSTVAAASWRCSVRGRQHALYPDAVRCRSGTSSMVARECRDRQQPDWSVSEMSPRQMKCRDGVLRAFLQPGPRAASPWPGPIRRDQAGDAARKLKARSVGKPASTAQPRSPRICPCPPAAISGLPPGALLRSPSARTVAASRPLASGVGWVRHAIDESAQVADYELRPLGDRRKGRPPGCPCTGAL